MKSRSRKNVSLVVLTAFVLQLVPEEVLASWLCPNTMISFELAATCDAGCEITCVESGNYNCGYTDQDGNAAFLPCVDNGLVCPIGDFQCYEDTCRQFGECTSSASDHDTHFCPLTGESYLEKGQCETNCFYQSYMCSLTNDLFRGFDEATGTVIPVGTVYNACLEGCYTCPAGMYLFEPQKICITQTCNPGDPFCDREVARTDPVCTDGAGFSFDPDDNLCVKPVEYVYTDCQAVTVMQAALQCPENGSVYEGVDADARCDFHCAADCVAMDIAVQTGEYRCPLAAVSSIFPAEESCRFECKTPVCDQGSVQGQECIYAPICDTGVYNPATKQCEEVIVATALPTPGACIPYDVQMSCESYFSYSDQWLCKENDIFYRKPAICKNACADDANCVGLTTVAEAIQAYMRLDTYTEFPTLEACHDDVIAFCTDRCDPAGQCVEKTYPDKTEYRCSVTEYQYAAADVCNDACCQDAIEICREACPASCPEGDIECLTACEVLCAPCDYTCDAVTVPVPSDWKRIDTLELYPTIEECEQAYFDDCYPACRAAAECKAITRDDTADWTCSLDGVRYQEEKDCKAKCLDEAECVISPDPVCPIGVRLPCNDLGNAATYTDADTSSSFAMYDNDGEVAADGTCVGEVYLFNGVVSECKPPGIKTGFHDCCDADTETVNAFKDQINQTEMIVNVGKAVYFAGQAVLAYQSYTAAIVAGDAFALEAVSATYGADLATIAATSSSATEAATSGIINGFSISPTAAVIAAAVYIAVEIFTRGCDADDLFTAAMEELGLCHYLEKRCTTDTIFGCVQRTKYYCCFASKLARIIHEQGRSQLLAFENHPKIFRPSLRKGDYDCRGFTPEEFARLDFSKIDLTEYYGDLQARIHSVIQDDLVEKLKTNALGNVQVKVPDVPIK